MSEFDKNAFFDWKEGMPIKAECSDCTSDYWPYGCLFCKNMKYYEAKEDFNPERYGPQECGLGYPTIKAIVTRFNNPHVKRNSYFVIYRTPKPEDLKE